MEDLERGGRQKGLSLNISNIGSKSPATINQERRLKARSAEIMLNESEVQLINNFKCCGYIFDKRCLIFSIQCILSLSIVTLSSVQLLRGVEDKALYCSFLSSVFGYWIKGPTLEK